MEQLHTSNLGNRFKFFKEKTKNKKNSNKRKIRFIYNQFVEECYLFPTITDP